MKEIFENVLKTMKSFDEYNKLKDSLEQENYINSVPNCFIPINEGDENLVFCYLIYNIYSTFCIKKSKPEDSKKLINYFNEKINNLNEIKMIGTKVKRKNKENLLKKKDNNKKKNVEIKNFEIDNKKNKNKETKKDTLKGQQKIKYIQKLNLFKPIIDIYLSEEFIKNRNFYLEKAKNEKYYKRLKYIYEIAIDLLLYCIVEFPNNTIQKSIDHFYKYFYEFEKDKHTYLKYLLEDIEAKLYDEMDNVVGENDFLQNKTYTIKFQNNQNKIEINPYDYVLEFLITGLQKYDYDEIVYKMKDIKNFSIQKCALNDNIFKREETNNTFNYYLKEIMHHEILRKTFNQIKNSSSKNYPLDNPKLLEQIKTNLLFIPFPTPHLSGLTLKRFGFILINTNRFYNDIEEEDNIISRFIKKLCESAFIIVTIIHEINFHYFLVILFQNNHSKLRSPSSPFKDYYIEEKNNFEDGGDMGEILLFGRPIKYFYLNALYKFLSLELWNNYKSEEKLDFIKLGKDFLKENDVIEQSQIKYEDFVKINNFTKCLEKEIEDDFIFLEIMPYNIMDEQTNLCHYFSKGKILGENDLEINLEDMLTKMNRGICITQHD